MSTLEHTQHPEYSRALAAEGEYWDNFIAQHLLRGELPGSIDWRLTFTQFRYNQGWRPFCLGPRGINFRMRELRYILEAATRQPGMRVLDLGCGAGWLSLELARRGAHVTGVDISHSNLALARYMASTNARNFPYLYQGFVGLPCKLDEFGSVEYIYGDLNTVSLPEEQYDAVVVWDSLHHVSELERLLDQVRHTLRPAGLFLGVDHAVTTQRTHEFNGIVMPIINGFYSWVTENDPAWLYEGAASLADKHDWGPLAVDHDATPVPDFGPFSEKLFGEMLLILKDSLRLEAIAESQVEGVKEGAPGGADEESPFEDVSAERLISALREEFDPQLFRTICPFIKPEDQIPHYRNEKERIFQNGLANLLIEAGEQAIAGGQADGQWFLFSTTRESSSERRMSSSTYVNSGIPTGEQQSQGVVEYARHLEEELERKNAALEELQRRIRTREAELVKVRKPRLPWKRR